MALQAAPAYIGDPTFEHPVELDRNILKAIFGRSGLIKPGDFALTPVVGAMEANIGPGALFIVGTEADSQGGYFVWSDEDEDVPWPAPAGSPRIDSLIVRVKDNQYGSITGSPGAEWFVATGTPSGSPSAISDAEFEPGGDFYEPGAWYRVANWRVDPGDTQLQSGADLTAFAQVVHLNAMPITTLYVANGTFNKPTGAKYIDFECQAGGGGAGGADGSAGGQAAVGGGGGGGAWCLRRMSAEQVSTSVAITVGQGGAGGVGNAPGSTGGSSSAGTYCGVSGGGGGVGTDNVTVALATGGAPGTGFTGSPDIVKQGSAGLPGIGIGGSYAIPGSGGASPSGGGAAAGPRTASGGANGAVGRTYGGGGSGASTLANATDRTGGAGGAGYVKVTTHF
jgi:hypothetical protein